MPEPDFECPQCGAVVRGGRTSCRECGSDARTGWKTSEEIDYQATDLEPPLPSQAVSQPVSRKMVIIAVVSGVLGILALVFGSR
ncbi:MAG: hypothetical protein AB7I19_04960 [Planctomycetota bacterium]